MQQKEQRLQEIIAHHAQLTNGRISTIYLNEMGRVVTEERSADLREKISEVIRFYEDVINELRKMALAQADVLVECYLRLRDFFTRKLGLV